MLYAAEGDSHRASDKGGSPLTFLATVWLGRQDIGSTILGLHARISKLVERKNNTHTHIMYIYIISCVYIYIFNVYIYSHICTCIALSRFKYITKISFTFGKPVLSSYKRGSPMICRQNSCLIWGVSNSKTGFATNFWVHCHILPMSLVTWGSWVMILFWNMHCHISIKYKTHFWNTIMKCWSSNSWYFVTFLFFFCLWYYCPAY